MNSQIATPKAASANGARPPKNLKSTASGQSQFAGSARTSAGAPPPVRPRSQTPQDKETDVSGASRATRLLTDGPSRREVVFQFENESAGEVMLAGSFTNWDEAPIRMRCQGAGAWQTKVLLPPGRYRYKFLVDGEWHDDPQAAEQCPNPFGTCDSVRVIS